MNFRKTGINQRDSNFDYHDYKKFRYYWTTGLC